MDLINRNPDIADEMNRFMRISYKDSWNKFIKRALESLEYFDYGTSHEIIEELSYKLEILNINKDTIIFQNGKPCKEIYI